MILVFVDRPCHVRGHLHQLLTIGSETRDEIDVQFIAPGLHWLAIDTRDTEHHRVILPSNTDDAYLLAEVD